MHRRFWLKEKIRQHGTKRQCSVCNNEAQYAISFDTLAGWLEEIWRKWFHVGTEQPIIYDNSDKVSYEQRGDEPYLLISELIECHSDEEEVIRSLIVLMTRGDNYEWAEGREVLIDDCQLYQERKLSRALVDNCWNSFVMDLKHHTRYFNKGALDFFNKLFEDLSEVHVLTTTIPFFLQKREKNKSVVQKYESGSLIVFRARKVRSSDDLLKIIKSPESELGNPPDRLAAEGRMNPKGISYFYGAEGRQTCVAELRPFLTEKVISAEFEVIEPVHILDLTLLAQGRHKRSSMFDDNYLEKRIHRQLLRQLHWLIAQPVLNGDEFEYLPTQVMAEYLARCTSPRIDGVIFESVQRKGGRNIVFFPHILNKENYSATDWNTAGSAIRLKQNTLVLHETTMIEYGVSNKNIDDYVIECMNNGYDLDYDYEDYS